MLYLFCQSVNLIKNIEVMKEKIEVVGTPEMVIKLKVFINERESLNIRSLEREAKMPYTSLSQFMGDKPKEFADHHWKNLIPVLEKYGWKS